MPDDLVKRLNTAATTWGNRITALTARLAALEQATGEDVVEMAMKAYVVAWHAAPKGKQSQRGVEAVLSAIAPTLRAQERERCIAAIESVATEVERRLYYGNDMPKAWAASLRECAATIRAGGSGG